MASAPRGAALRQIQRVFGEGTLSGLSDSQLLEKFLDGRDEAAFTALGRAAWDHGSGNMPGRASQRRRGRRCLPGHVSGLGL